MNDLTHIDLFSGIGGFALAAGWAGFRTIQFVEIDPFCQKVLRKHWPEVPIHDDIKTFKWTGDKPTLLTGGFPCQPFSCAGKRRGKADDRYLWPEMLRVVREAKPRWVLAENVAGIINMELGQVLADLEGEGYYNHIRPDGRKEIVPVVIPACAVNAPHRRDRVWVVGYADVENPRCRMHEGSQKQESSDKKTWEPTILPKRPTGSSRFIFQDTSNLIMQTNCNPKAMEQRGTTRGWRERPIPTNWGMLWTEVATCFCRVDDGLPAWVHARRVARLKALGNAIVPQVAHEIIKVIAEIELTNESSVQPLGWRGTHE